jgi:hypothetical protein
MKFNFGAPEAADLNQPIYLPYPLADLRAGANFKLRKDANAGNVYVSGYIANIGNVAVRKPFLVALGVTITQQSTSSFEIIYSTERRTTVSDIGVGEQIETAETQAPLIYRDEGNARYDIELIVDVDNDVTELKSNNNRSSLEWYFYKPSASSRDGQTVFIDNLPKRRAKK